MHRSLGIVSFAAIVVATTAWTRPGVIPPASVTADSAPSRCLSADTVSDRLLDSLRQMATADSGKVAARRAQLRLPTLASARDVQQVTSGDRCRIAARAVDSVWTRAKISTHDAKRRVYLFLFGDHFAVIDAKSKTGARQVISSFSPTWKSLGTVRF